VATDFVSPAVYAAAGQYALGFQQAQPFRHVVIDNFLKPECARQLVDSFPAHPNPSQLVNEFGAPGCAILKHANPCGVALAEDALAAYNKAYQTDPTSAFGGIIAFNCPVDADAAALVAKLFVEVLIAPRITTQALAVFAAKPNTRVLQIALPKPTDDSPWQQGRNAQDIKRVGSGLLIQTADNRELRRDEIKIVTTLQPTPQQLDDLMFAWKVAKYVKSNAIVFCGGGMTLGVGAGQMSRIDSARIASIKAEKAEQMEVAALKAAATKVDFYTMVRDRQG
jgi:phosphoribosylaminoimidazolecarboxamide formyltransferase/IMP cyclohydrolase